MSAADDDNDDVAPYRVGYSRPPEEHRFKKGRSGNPKGRPRKARASRALSTRLIGSDEPTSALILEEAYRTVPVRIQVKVIKMPVNQAIIRALQQNALSGNRIAQRDLTMLVLEIEKQQKQSQAEYFSALTDYKLDGEREIARCKKLGLDPPDLIPHPDDIEIDPRNGTACVNGPVTPEEKWGLDMMLARRDEAADDVRKSAHRYKRLRDANKQKFVMIEWIRAQEVFDLINDGLPARYKATLANRHHSEAKDTPEPSPRDDGSEAT